MPAAAVKPAPRVVGAIAGLKGSVGGPVSPRGNPAAQRPDAWGDHGPRDRERPGVRAGEGRNLETPRGPAVAKAPGQNGSDAEGRRPGERRGLDTPVVLAVNDAR